MTYRERMTLQTMTAMIIIAVFYGCAPTEKFLMRQRMNMRETGGIVRVLLMKTDAPVTLSCAGGLSVRDAQTGAPYAFADPNTLPIDPESVRKPLTVEAANPPLTLNGVPYRGTFELRNVLGTLYVINRVSLEEYLYSVVPSEIPALWKKEALKAQAIAARTYACYHLQSNKEKRLYDLDATTKFQVYRGTIAEKPEATSAVDETAGTILTYENMPILSFFHSTCGGKTVDDKFVWTANDLSYLEGTACPFCKDSPKYSWETKLSLDEMRKSLGRNNHRVGRIRSIVFKRNDDRVTSVVITHSQGTLRITGNEFRALFPEDAVKSLQFRSRRVGHGLVLTGNGFGHGVGLCQWGAQGMALRGATCKAILRYYYKGIDFGRLPVARKNSDIAFAGKENVRD